MHSARQQVIKVDRQLAYPPKHRLGQPRQYRHGNATASHDQHQGIQATVHERRQPIEQWVSS
ncbi:MAG: hypothetical protein RLZZ239_808, partial [Pseudomonadota bacterium]